ncbi:BTAD domain-containing putative transcriptional regulator [Kineococcus sp. SYSU DK006]|uniref:BTAD domain-containing putative transcriptional regulator n=1 Tax=Kineococcus sp. SYSU DK006 TaxID=3383127 RepID=UPI003D7DCECD
MRIDLLGPVRVRADDGTEVAVAGARLRRLLAQLALRAGRPVSTAALEAALWNGEGPSGPGALQSLVSRLRRALGAPGRVGAGPAGYVLDVDPGDVDVVRFERACAAGRRLLRTGDAEGAARELAAALALWRGEPVELEGTADAVRLRELHLECLGDRAEADLRAGHLQGLAAELEALTAAHPLRERFAELQVRVLTATGRGAEALAAYERTRRHLAQELGTDPSPALRAAHRQALDGAGAPAVAPSAAAPLPALTSFVGRDADVQRLQDLLGAARCVSVVGPGGAGKTRLATEVAAAVASRAEGGPGDGCAGSPAGRGGVHLVPLAPVAEGADVLGAVVAAVGAREAHRERLRPPGGSAEDPRSRLLAALSAGPQLLVLDNCEHVLDETAVLVEDLLRHCPSLTVLATSREALGVEGEVLHPLGPLRPPPPGADLEVVRANPAVRLFVDRAAAGTPGFTVTAQEADLVADLVRRLDGLPLALELAAARLRTTGLVQLHERLSDRFRLLTGGRRTAVARHRTLRAVVDWSWDLLGADERALLRRLSVFAAPVSVEAAAAVHPDAGDAVAVADLLASLAEKSLLQLRPTDPVRYALLETIREYGAERLAEAGEVERVRELRTRWALGVAARAGSGLRGPGQAAWSLRLDAESEDLLAALRDLVAAGRRAQALRLALPVALWWTVLGRHTPARDWLALARSAGVPGTEGPGAEDELVAEALELLDGIMAGELNAETAAVLEHVRDLTARLAAHGGDTPSAVVVLAQVFLHVFAEGFTGPADHALLDRMPVPQDADPFVRALCELLRAATAENVGDLGTVRSAAARAEEGFRSAGESWGLAGALRLRAHADLFDGDLDAARERLAEAVRLVGAFGSTEDELQLRMRLADVEQRRGRPAAAAEQVQRMRELAPATSGSTRVWLALTEVSTARCEGRHEEAERFVRAGLAALGAGDAPGAVGWNHERAALQTSLAHLRLDAGDLRGARELLAATRPVALRTRDMPIVALFAVAAARWCALSGRDAEAAELLGASASLRGADDLTDPEVTALRERLRAALGERGFEEVFTRGRRLDPPAALERTALLG